MPKLVVSVLSCHAYMCLNDTPTPAHEYTTCELWDLCMHAIALSCSQIGDCWRAGIQIFGKTLKRNKARKAKELKEAPT